MNSTRLLSTISLVIFILVVCIGAVFASEGEGRLWGDEPTSDGEVRTGARRCY